MNDDLALVTPTSDRPWAFQLCERWMSRAIANYPGKVHWYVADDGRVPARCTLGQTHIHRSPCDSPVESFLGNLAAALAEVQSEKIVFIEDDDWYSPNYLADYSQRLNEADIVGEACAKYYSVSQRKYHIWDNCSHASLCQTGIRRSVLEWFLPHAAETRTPFVDQSLWSFQSGKYRRLLRPESQHCIGMKSLPGKMGITACHDGTTDWDRDDVSGEILRSWIGAEDAAVYLSLTEETRDSGRIL